LLDSTFISTLPLGDIVYSWGVLHHTGDMYTAPRSTAKLVAPSGLLCIAIYNRVSGRVLGSGRCWKIKRRYNHSPRAIQRAMEIAYLSVWTARQLYRRRNPIRAAEEYKQSRGMGLKTDVIDLARWISVRVRHCRRDCRVLPSGMRTPRAQGHTNWPAELWKQPVRLPAH
jgi:hypothetical protein